MEPVSVTVTKCVEQRVGAVAARAIVSGARQLTAGEEAALGDCVLESAFAATTGRASTPLAACLNGRLGTEAAQAITSGSRQLTADEQTIQGDCVLASAFGAASGRVSPAVAACLEDRLGAKAAQAIVSNAREATAGEQAVVGDCILAAALAPAEDTASPAVAACLSGRLGAEAAQAAASGSRALTAGESSVLGGCLLEAALGARP
jgi:hypothetical protein